jgi:RHH-type proline utilization regulon transcriptional repressor/proline dehydrogenase/delta 1-pyrroline-5-carboxylate dehydrogenase
VFINFDMEPTDLKDLTLDLWFKRCCEAVDFEAGLAMQAYLKSAATPTPSASSSSRRTGRRVTVRLVKGAYWDYETIHAEQMGWPCPVWSVKRDDRRVLRADDADASSTPRRTARTERGRRQASPSGRTTPGPSPRRARGDGESRALPRERDRAADAPRHGRPAQAGGAEMGLRVREYVPVGEMIPGMAYLVRRLLENTSNESWLKAGFLDEADPEVLLADPVGLAQGNGHAQGLQSVGIGEGRSVKRDLYEVAPERHGLSPAVEGVGDGRPFFNEPLRDFAEADQREAFAAAVARARVPERPALLTEEQAEAALASAHAAFPRWRDTDPRERAACLVRAAAILRSRRDELSGVMVKEGSKAWREADADLCEAIDFLEYYARLAVPMFERSRLGRFIGELDETWYQPKGVAVVIAPWNFPSAIFTGMTSAAVVTGNCALVKPAQQTVGIASLCVEALWEAGVPRDVLQLCHARGATVGAIMVRDPRVSMIAFTGSKEVGLDIIEGAATVHPGQANVKKIISEMGGKNAIVVDTSADLDEAVIGVRYSAFGYQGQKCSACSRCVVVDPRRARRRHHPPLRGPPRRVHALARRRRPHPAGDRRRRRHRPEGAADHPGVHRDRQGRGRPPGTGDGAAREARPRPERPVHRDADERGRGEPVVRPAAHLQRG